MESKEKHHELAYLTTFWEVKSADQLQHWHNLWISSMSFIFLSTKAVQLASPARGQNNQTPNSPCALGLPTYLVVIVSSTLRSPGRLLKVVQSSTLSHKHWRKHLPVSTDVPLQGNLHFFLSLPKLFLTRLDLFWVSYIYSHSSNVKAHEVHAKPIQGLSNKIPGSSWTHH